MSELASVAVSAGKEGALLRVSVKPRGCANAIVGARGEVLVVSVTVTVSRVWIEAHDPHEVEKAA